MSDTEQPKTWLHQAHMKASEYASSAVHSIGEDWNQLYWERLMRSSIALVTMASDHAPYEAPATYPGPCDPDYQWRRPVYLEGFDSLAALEKMIGQNRVWWPTIRDTSNEVLRTPSSLRWYRMAQYGLSFKYPITGGAIQATDEAIYQDFIEKYPHKARDMFMANTMGIMSRRIS